MPRSEPSRARFLRWRRSSGGQAYRLLLGLLLALGMGLACGSLARAQVRSPNQPLAIDAAGVTPPPCPLVVAAKDYATQPLRLKPSEVAAKNAMGCLSPADAVYGPDGCPVRLCSTAQGSMPLPAAP